MEKIKAEETVEEIKEVVNMAVDELKSKVAEIEEEKSQDEDVNDDVVEADLHEVDEFSDSTADDVEICQDQKDTKSKSNRKIPKATKYVVAAGVGVTVITAGVLLRRNTVKTALHVARAFI